jgi:hypothetical protein
MYLLSVLLMLILINSNQNKLDMKNLQLSLLLAVSMIFAYSAFAGGGDTSGIASMLLPTNDEACASIPGPQCGGAPFSPNDSGEGFVYVHSGIHGIGDLSASQYSWNNPVLKVTIKRLK